MNVDPSTTIGTGAADSSSSDRLRARSWTIWPFRVLVTIQVIQLFNQSVFAGQFLSGDFGALKSHRDHAIFALITMIVIALAALLLKWPGGGTLWPFAASAGLSFLIYVQIELGYMRSLALHIPLGVAIIVAASFMTVWSWWPRP
ncbi:MAG: hypothetical protein WBA63_11690 [Thermomicrobiales bacterium]